MIKLPGPRDLLKKAVFIQRFSFSLRFSFLLIKTELAKIETCKGLEGVMHTYVFITTFYYNLVFIREEKRATLQKDCMLNVLRQTLLLPTEHLSWQSTKKTRGT